MDKTAPTPWAKHALMFSPVMRELVAGSAFGLIDCGARDNVPEPWASFATHDADSLVVLGFEADPEEAARLNSQFNTRRRYVPAAAWNSAGRRPFYLTTPPQTSSLFPPNDTLTHLFAPSGNNFVNIAEGRVLNRVLDVPTTTIDAAIKEISFDADFLKIDTQGAEYEILEGAATTLDTSLFGVVAETWTAEIYKGIKLSWEVMALMAARGYIYMTHELAGLARRNFPDAQTLGFHQHNQIISLEVLFFREPSAFVKNAADAKKVFRAVGIADVYGFADVGVELLRHLVMRWPNELANVQRCYNEMSSRRGVYTGQSISALYPRLRG
jgi:FkbM family methyltransferase